MVTFLFWNLKKNDCLSSIERLARRYDVDLLLLAESNLDVDKVLRGLTSGQTAGYHFNPGYCRRITVFSKCSSQAFWPVHESDRISIRRLRTSARNELLIAVAHLHSKLHRSNEEQALAVSEIAREIVRIEEKVGHCRTLLVGDLNMNPFEHGLVAATCLHATMDRRIAARGSRTVYRKSHRFFYNPMWSLMGDASPGPPGTYYRAESGHIAYFWHIFDQVLVRPDLLDAFDSHSLSIIDSDGTIPLTRSSGVPDETIASDHLPILFRVNC